MRPQAWQCNCAPTRLLLQEWLQADVFPLPSVCNDRLPPDRKRQLGMFTRPAMTSWPSACKALRGLVCTLWYGPACQGPICTPLHESCTHLAHGTKLVVCTTQMQHLALT